MEAPRLLHADGRAAWMPTSGRRHRFSRTDVGTVERGLYVSPLRAMRWSGGWVVKPPHGIPKSP